MRIKTKVDEINSSMDEVYNVMVKIGIILEKKIYECFFWKASTNHTIRECEEFVAMMMDWREIEFPKRW